jgi:hypothetical protein
VQSSVALGSIGLAQPKNVNRLQVVSSALNGAAVMVMGAAVRLRVTTGISTTSPMLTMPKSSTTGDGRIGSPAGTPLPRNTMS